MREEKWLASKDPKAMLKFLGRRSKRKFRLLACACVRRIWHLLENERSRQLVILVEAVAEDETKEFHLPHALDRAKMVILHTRSGSSARAAECTACVMPDYLPQLFRCAAHSTVVPYSYSRKPTRQEKREYREQAILLREIFGNSFRPIDFDPNWLTSTVVAISTGIYNDRASDRMPILADALQDAGCENEDMLNHCRQPGEHVRGCWVVDLLLGKE
jgi:hypothetical protein